MASSFSWKALHPAFRAKAKEANANRDGGYRSVSRARPEGRAHLLDTLEGDRGQLIVEIGPQLVVAGDREIALRLDDQEAGRHADFEPPLFGVEALLREFAAQFRRLDALAILFESQRRRDFATTDTSRLRTRAGCSRSTRTREVGFVSRCGQADRKREPHGPGRKVGVHT